MASSKVYLLSDRPHPRGRNTSPRRNTRFSIRLAVLFLAAVLAAMVTSCGNLLVDFNRSKKGPTYPVFDFEIRALYAPAVVGIGSPELSLTWAPIPAGMTDAELIAELEKSLNRWRLFERTIDPLPFYDVDGDRLTPDLSSGGGGLDDSHYDVFETSAGQLDNTGSHPIVIHRYWPEVTDGSNPVAPNAADWLNILVERQRGFQQAVAQINTMMADLAASPLFAREALQTLHGWMAESISYNSPTYTPLAQFYVISSASGFRADYEPGKSGFLYEYYLGYLPPASQYKVAGPYGFPRTE